MSTVYLKMKENSNCASAVNELSSKVNVILNSKDSPIKFPFSLFQFFFLNALFASRVK